MSADPLKPVAGVSLQKYAELAVKMRAAGSDREACAQIAAQEGIHRLAWEHAMVEWNSRLRSEATKGAVVAAYYKHYQRALLHHSERAATATFDAYIEMTAMIRTETQEPRKRPADVKSMCRAYGIDETKWVEISRHWVTKLTHDPALFATFSDRVRTRVLEMDAAYLSRP